MRHVLGPMTVAAFLVIVGSAQAMPLTTVAAAYGTPVLAVRDDCGPFGHRSHYGYCKDNLHPELTYQPGQRRGGYDAFEGRRAPRYEEEDDGGYYERRCFIRETYDGPVRICR